MFCVCCDDGRRVLVRGDPDGLLEGDLLVGAPVLKGDPEGTFVSVGDPVSEGDPEGTSVLVGVPAVLEGDPEGTPVLREILVGCLDKGVGESVGIFVGFLVGSWVTTSGEQL